MSFWSRWFSKNPSKPGAVSAPKGLRPTQDGELIEVGCVREEYAWLAEHRCDCGGEWALQQQSKMKAPGQPDHVVVDRLEGQCGRCQATRSWDFAIDTRSDAYRNEIRETMRELGIDPEDL